MRKTVHKGFFVWNYDKEEQWLNEMSAKGLALVSAGFFRYEFEDCKPDEYIVRLELLKHSKSHPESENYIDFVESTGAEYVGAFNRWVYFRKKSEDGSFELYSDNGSKIRQIKLIIRTILLISLLNVFIGFDNVFMAISLESPKNFAGFINLALGFAGLLGTWRLWKKKKRIEQDKDIFE